LAAGGTTLYDSTKPFKMVWTEALKDVAWWKKEVEDPCLLYLTKTSSLGNLLGDDAPIDTKGKGGGASSVAGSELPGLGVNGGGGGRSRLWAGTGGSENGRPKQKSKVHNVEQGYYVTNRANSSLCPDFQGNNCQQTVNQQNKCPGGTHQCSRCLSRDHGAQGCDKPPPSPQKKGKGKGKGGRKGKGYNP